MARATHGGGVVFRRGEAGPLYLLVEARSSKGRWVLPKGGIDRRESAEEAALREVAEEAALEARAVQALGRARLEKGGDRIHVEFFLMEYVRDAKPFESREVRWFRFDAAVEALDDVEAIRLLRRAHELVVAAHLPPGPSGPAARAARLFLEGAPPGILAMLLVALPFAPELARLVRSRPAAALGIAGSAIVLAPPLGFLVTRLAQTLLAPLERHLRLRAGLEETRGALEMEDVFGTDAARVRLRPRDAETAERLRGRARLAGILAVLLPGVTAAGIQLGARLRGEEWWPALIPVAYALAAAGTLGVLRFVGAPAPDDAAAVRAYAKRRGLLRTRRSKGESTRALADLAAAPLLWAALGLLAFSFALPLSFEAREAVPFEGRWIAVAVAGSALSALSGWTWWRATRRREHVLLDPRAR